VIWIVRRFAENMGSLDTYAVDCAAVGASVVVAYLLNRAVTDRLEHLRLRVKANPVFA
jgi:hypothetical protein